ncbi:MAG TPA: tetratricopeptide repeat protein [Saprospiraceae bacterium]|nr:tetratricopeptide repeat protein [Saprospiraceae bacterium]
MKRTPSKKYWIHTLLIITLMSSSCVTQKRKEDISALGKVYHNTTARYNGYFNAKELLAASEISLADSHQDNYNQLLPLYLSTANENPQAMAPNMDAAIEKVTRVVALHPEAQWVDDSYLLVGKAHYYKQDYESAEKALRYLVNNFDPVELAKEEAAAKARKDKKKEQASRKKAKKKSAKKRRRQYIREQKRRRRMRKKGKKVEAKKSRKEEVADAKKAEIEAAKKAEAQFEEPDNYGLKHRPAHQEGQLWLARTLIERDNYDTALRILNNLLQNPKIYDDVLPKAWEALAYYHVYREDYGSAIQPLEQSIATTKSRNEKARKGFVLAQLYEQINNGAKAYAAYGNVLKSNPDFEMAFNCRLNMALNSWRGGNGSPQQAFASLEKMAKEDKNYEYRDQIYYAMAEIALEQGDKNEAISLFKESLSYNTNNNSQRSESYLALADLYYDGEKYVPAKLYYDSTASVMKKSDERFVRVSSLSENLADIAKNIQIIEEKDSLLALGLKSEAALKKLAFNQLQAQQEATRAAATSGNSGAVNGARALPAGGALQAESSFFAYDDRAVKRGTREFQRKWGNRPLADNWRLSSSSRDAFATTAGEGESVIENTTALDALTDDQLNELLSDIPRTDSDRSKAELAILDAMFALGTLYRDRLQNNEKATEVLEELNQRFPRSNYELESWYYLYLSYYELNNRSKSFEYRDKILDRYASSKYARVLTDPEYAERMANEELAINDYYDEAYKAFHDGQTQKARDMALDARTKFGVDNPLQPRFDLLHALAIGKMDGETAYKSSLNQVIAKHPNTDEQRTAREILRMLGAGSRLPVGAEEQAQGNFRLNDNQVHFVIVAFDPSINLNTAKANVSDYNQKFHRPQRLTISNVFLGNNADDRIPMLIVRRFKDRTEAMKYHDGVQQNSNDFLETNADYDLFAISLNNYREILRSKSIESYQTFFADNYLGR